MIKSVVRTTSQNYSYGIPEEKSHPSFAVWHSLKLPRNCKAEDIVEEVKHVVTTPLKEVRENNIIISVHHREWFATVEQ